MTSTSHFPSFKEEFNKLPREEAERLAREYIVKNHHALRWVREHIRYTKLRISKQRLKDDNIRMASLKVCDLLEEYFEELLK